MTGTDDLCIIIYNFIYTFIVTFVVLFRMDAIMAWIALFSAPFLLLISRYIMRRMREYRKRVLELNSGMMSFEVETFFLQQRGNLSRRFNSLVGTVPGMLNSAISAHRIRELMDLPAERHDPDAFAEVERTAAQGLTVSLNDVSFAYQEGENIYTHAAYTAAPGEIVAVLAPSGGGKTTFMRLLPGMLELDSGSVTLTTADGREVPVNADLRTLFSYVPQGNTVLSGTVADNLRMVR